MEQLELFSSPETLKRNIERTLTEGEFHRCKTYCEEFRGIDPDHELLALAVDVTKFWTGEYDYDRQHRDEGHLTAYRRWRRFEEYLAAKSSRPNPILAQMKGRVFLTWMGLESVTPELRSAFDQQGISALDLLVEIENWQLAQREIEAIRLDRSHAKGDRFFLTCSKVYYRAGYVARSRNALLSALWNRPDLIQLTDIMDQELLEALSELDTCSGNEDDMVELLPYVGLMNGIFHMPRDLMSFLPQLQKKIEWCVTSRDVAAGRRHLYRLFSLYAWYAELAKRTGSDYVETRRRMKRIDGELFRHYKENLSCRHQAHST